MAYYAEIFYVPDSKGGFSVIGMDDYSVKY
jgi:hypothetical protein